MIAYLILSINDLKIRGELIKFGRFWREKFEDLKDSIQVKGEKDRGEDVKIWNTEKSKRFKLILQCYSAIVSTIALTWLGPKVSFRFYEEKKGSSIKKGIHCERAKLRLRSKNIKECYELRVLENLRHQDSISQVSHASAS